MPGTDQHEYDEDGHHDSEDCERCIEEQHAVTCSCTCGNCCEQLIVEVSMRDADREPRIAEKGKPLYDMVDGRREQIGYLLNGPSGACVLFDSSSRRCTIYETRPLVCRVYNCDDPQDDCEDVAP